jgi:hypothetical protein
MQLIQWVHGERANLLHDCAAFWRQGRSGRFKQKKPAGSGGLA